MLLLLQNVEKEPRPVKTHYTMIAVIWAMC